MAGLEREEADLPPSAELGDAELLARHVAGDRTAFGVLVTRHRDRLWAIALRTLGDREEAADALQDALISALRSAHTFQGRSAVTTWLHRIVVNACLDRARRAASRRTKSLDAMAAPDDRPALDALVPAAEPTESLVIRQEVRREVGAALAELPADQRAALVLVDMQGYPVAEAAELLGVPVGTVKSRCARGRAKLLPLVRHLRAGAEDDGVPRGPSSSVSRGPSSLVSRETRPPGNPQTRRPVPSAGPAVPAQESMSRGDATSR